MIICCVNLNKLSAFKGTSSKVAADAGGASRVIMYLESRQLGRMLSLVGVRGIGIPIPDHALAKTHETEHNMPSGLASISHCSKMDDDPRARVLRV